MQTSKDMNIENGRDIQNLLNKENSSNDQLLSLENRLLAIEMKMSVDVQSQLEAYQNALQTMGDLNARKEVQLIQTYERLNKTEAMVKDYVELIDSMNEKITLAEDSNNKTRSTLHKKL